MLTTTQKVTIRKDLATFKGRRKLLEGVTRYSTYNRMHYRTNLWNHCRRVSWLAQELEQFAVKAFGEEYDPLKAYALALVHDDAEIVTGDVQAGDKSKMTKAQLDAVDENEKNAIPLLTARFPTQVGGYEYKTLLEEALYKNSLEAQVVMLADKLDAFGEALHEVFAGNTHFITLVENQYGTIPIACDFYINWLRTAQERYPRLAAMYDPEQWFFQIPERIDFEEICYLSKPHKATNIARITEYPNYDEWKQILIARSTPAELSELYIIREP